MVFVFNIKHYLFSKAKHKDRTHEHWQTHSTVPQEKRLNA